jgi:hypothetical protein
MFNALHQALSYLAVPALCHIIWLLLTTQSSIEVWRDLTIPVFVNFTGSHLILNAPEVMNGLVTHACNKKFLFLHTGVSKRIVYHEWLITERRGLLRSVITNHIMRQGSNFIIQQTGR